MAEFAVCYRNMIGQTGDPETDSTQSIHIAASSASLGRWDRAGTVQGPCRITQQPAPNRSQRIDQNRHSSQATAGTTRSPTRPPLSLQGRQSSGSPSCRTCCTEEARACPSAGWSTACTGSPIRSCLLAGVDLFRAPGGVRFCRSALGECNTGSRPRQLDQPVVAPARDPCE